MSLLMFVVSQLQFLCQLPVKAKSAVGLLHSVSMGDGWRFKFPRITWEYKKTFLHMADGSTFEYDINGTGPSNLKNYPTEDMVLTREANGTYILSYHDGRKEFFSSSGMITRITDRFGNEITFAYDANNIRITDNY